MSVNEYSPEQMDWVLKNAAIANARQKAFLKSMIHFDLLAEKADESTQSSDSTESGQSTEISTTIEEVSAVGELVASSENKV